MKQAINFKIIVTQDEDGVFVASCPAIPGCHSQGDTYEEAMQHVEEAIQLCLKVSEKDANYRSQIDFNQQSTPRFIGVSDLSVPTPSFL